MYIGSECQGGVFSKKRSGFDPPFLFGTFLVMDPLVVSALDWDHRVAAPAPLEGGGHLYLYQHGEPERV